MPNPSTERLPFAVVPAGLAVRIRLTPKAARDRIIGVAADAAGEGYVKLAVTAAPEKGKANAAMIKALAKAWNIPKTQISVAAGAKDRRKVVLLAGDGKILAAHLAEWLGGLDD